MSKTLAAQINEAAKMMVGTETLSCCRKVWVSELHAVMFPARRSYTPMSLDAFKAELARLVTTGAVRLCRADIVDAHERATAEASEVMGAGRATFHKVAV